MMIIGIQHQAREIRARRVITDQMMTNGDLLLQADQAVRARRVVTDQVRAAAGLMTMNGDHLLQVAQVREALDQEREAPDQARELVDLMMMNGDHLLQVDQAREVPDQERELVDLMTMNGTQLIQPQQTKNDQMVESAHRRHQRSIQKVRVPVRRNRQEIKAVVQPRSARNLQETRDLHQRTKVMLQAK